MKIAIDIDDVLADFMVALIEFHNKTYKTKFKKNDFFSYNLWEVWGGTRKEAAEKIFKFHKTSIYRNIKPITGSVEAIKKLRRSNELYVITSRHSDVIENTKKWIDKYFPDLFLKIYFSNSFYGRSKKLKKSDICRQLKADMLIEDSFEYAIDCLRPNRKIILFRRPWNKKYTIPKEISVVNNWSEVLKTVNKQS
jgi:uncharacterized HAD superfamily protein